MSALATYSPDDNKIRISSDERFPKEVYDRLREAGFGWAPKQKQMIAPMWTPGREDIALEVSGQESLEDEDTTLAERAEDRAERFEDYSGKRADEGARAQEGVSAIAGQIPFGQPILIGHHSERRARKMAEKIDNGMRKAVKLWETAAYWERRAKSAIAHAKYKELPGVRHRRMKGIESDKRKSLRMNAESEKFIKLWSVPNITREQALAVANYDHNVIMRPEPGKAYGESMYSMLCTKGEEAPRMTAEQAAEFSIAAHRRMIERRSRWLTHYDNRLAYERAMLGETTGSETVAGQWKDLAVGCRIKARAWNLSNEVTWYVVSKLNKGADGQVNSVTVLPVKPW